MIRTLLCTILIVAAPVAALAVDEVPESCLLENALYQEDFVDFETTTWTFADPASWQVHSVSGSEPVLALIKDSTYSPPVRSPRNIAWINELEVGSFILAATVRSTERPYGHRDLCFLFGIQDASHFYYVHLATAADDHAHSIFVVDGAARKSIATERTSGFDWDNDWHHVVIRRDSNGPMEVYVDDLSAPVMRASDDRFGSGHIGFGSFDDTGELAEIRICKYQ